MSVAFLRDVGGYLSGLALYRTRGPDDWVGWFARTLEHAATSATETLAAVATLVASWPGRLEGVRSDAAARRLLDHVVTHPALDVAAAAGLLGVSLPTARAALETLAEREVLRRDGPARFGEARSSAPLVGRDRTPRSPDPMIDHPRRRARSCATYSSASFDGAHANQASTIASRNAGFVTTLSWISTAG